jgi:5-methylcytosine-specific restriction enzyme subunit McrC
VHFTRLNEHYRPAVALARVVLEGSSFELRAGQRSMTGFVVNMNKLFEQFLQVTLTEAIEKRFLGRLHSQRQDHLDQGCLARIVPDLTWIVEGAPRAVIDAKYKTLAKGGPSDDDLYQIIAYCVALGVRQAYLVHATASATPVVMVVGVDDIVVHIAGLDLKSPLKELRSQVESLAYSIASGTRVATTV